MNKDIKLFSDIANHLIYLTTNDEYGSSRSKGIESLAELAEELNNIGISAPRGDWTENSLALWLRRTKKRYPTDVLYEGVNFEMIGTCAWEHISSTRRTEITHKRKSKPRINAKRTPQSYPLINYEQIDGEIWKEHELRHVVCEDRKIIKIKKYFDTMTP